MVHIVAVGPQSTCDLMTWRRNARDEMREDEIAICVCQSGHGGIYILYCVVVPHVHT